MVGTDSALDKLPDCVRDITRGFGFSRFELVAAGIDAKVASVHEVRAVADALDTGRVAWYDAAGGSPLISGNPVKVAGETIPASGEKGCTTGWQVERYWRDEKLGDTAASTSDVRPILIERELSRSDVPCAQ